MDRSSMLMTDVRVLMRPPEQVNAIRITGQVKWFDFTKGYGFITPSQGGDDILLHQVCVRHSGFRTVQEGATVVCETIMGTRGPSPTGIEDISSADPACANVISP